MLALLVDLGATAEWTATNTGAGGHARRYAPSRSTRLSAPRSARRSCWPGRCSPASARSRLPPPGGDVIGRRRVDTHFLALEQLGASVTVGDRYELEAKELSGADIFLDEPSVTGTENALMAAVMAKGRTVLRNAACEPHVQDLARAWWRWARRSRGSAPTSIPSRAAGRWRGASYAIGPDHIEIGSFIGLAAVTNGEIAIDPVRGEDLRSTLLGFERLGIRPRVEGTRLIVSSDQERRIRPDLGGHVPKLEDGPWPAFPADVMSTTIVTATQCSGMLLVFEKMFESRLFFVDKLIGMGARIVLCDPAPRGDLGTLAAQGRHGGVARHPRRDGDAARGAGGGRRRAPSTTWDRSSGVRAHRRAPARPRSRDRARGWVASQLARRGTGSRERCRRVRAHSSWRDQLRTRSPGSPGGAPSPAAGSISGSGATRRSAR